MKAKPDRFFCSRLLSGKNGLSVLEKEAILSNILRQTRMKAESRGPSWPWTRSLRWAACAVAILAIVPLAVLILKTDQASDFRSKGSAHGPSGFSICCLGAKAESTCRQGNKLVFRLTPPQKKPFFSAFAQREDGTIVWYLPGAGSAQSIEAPQDRGEGILPVGVLLGPEHPPGKYRVFGVFSERPLTQEQIRSIFEDRGPIGEEAFSMTQQLLVIE